MTLSGKEEGQAGSEQNQWFQLAALSQLSLPFWFF